MVRLYQSNSFTKQLHSYNLCAANSSWCKWRNENASLPCNFYKMQRLVSIQSVSDIPVQYRNTPISLLFEYHNLKRPYDTFTQAEMLIGMCMDNRKHLRIPDNFSYIIRTGGANMRYSEFRVSYAIAVGGAKFMALIGHSNCGMVNLMSRREIFIKGLVENAGWTRDEAEEHFYHYEPVHEIGSETDFILSEVKRLRLRYPKIIIAPLFYKVEDGLLYWIREEN